jgi:hypothetical protein
MSQNNQNIDYEHNEILSGVSNEDYHKHHAVGSSGCKDLLQSPWLFQHKQENPRPQTPAMAFGSLFHSLVLEPETFADNYFIADKPKRNSKAGKEAYSELLKECGTRTWITKDEYLKAEDMKYPLYQNQLAKSLLSGGSAEQATLWQDTVTGTLCKAKADYINLDRGYIADLKTTANSASEFSFARTIEQYKYHLSAAFYRDGFFLATGKFLDFYIIAVEKEAPYNFATYKLSDSMLAIGGQLYRQGLMNYADAVKCGKFDTPHNNGQLIEIVA